MPLLLALCVLLLECCLPLLDALLQRCQPALPLLLALLAKQFTGHPLQREDAHSLHAQMNSDDDFQTRDHTYTYSHLFTAADSFEN